MGITKLVALLLGSGALMGKSSYDLRQKANNPVSKAELEVFNERIAKNDMKLGYNRVLEFDLIHYKIRQNLEWIHSKEESLRSSGVEESELRETAEKAWLYNMGRDYYDRGYSYREYVLEWARKSVWNSGYMPTPGRPYKNNRYNVVYTGKYPCNMIIDYVNGIPDQEFRHLLSLADRYCPYTIAGLDVSRSPEERAALLQREKLERMERELF